jgi:hypothetical protein
VTIGIHAGDPSQDRILTAIGVKGVTTGDERAEANAVAAYINAHGGVAKRNLALTFHFYGTNTEPFSASYQEACAAFTQDTKVFGVLTTSEFQQLDVLAACLKAAGSLLVFESRILYDRAVFDQYAPFLYSPSYLDGDRWGVIPDVLHTNGFFDKNAKTGLIYMDTPNVRRVKDRVLKPRLAALGQKVVVEAPMDEYNSVGGLSDVAAAMSQDVLRFRGAGVTHIIFVGTSGTAPQFFLGPAQSQGYHPRYGFTSAEIPQIEAAQGSSAQLKDALGVGWWPTYDVDYAQDPGLPAATQCRSIYDKAGIRFTSRFAYNDAIDICDALFFIKTALDAAPAPNAAGFRNAVDTLGTRYASPYTFATSFGPGRYDGASAVRAEAFDDSCQCWKYVGALTPAP